MQCLEDETPKRADGREATRAREENILGQLDRGNENQINCFTESDP